MEELKSHSWSVHGNDLHIGLMKYYIKIKLQENYALLQVIYNSQVVGQFKFPNMEEAVEFTEEYITKCEHIEDIHQQYDYKTTITGKILYQHI